MLHVCQVTPTIIYNLLVFWQGLPNLKVVDLSYNKVADVKDLHLTIGNVSKLALAHNLLTSLEGTVPY